MSMFKIQEFVAASNGVTYHLAPACKPETADHEHSYGELLCRVDRWNTWSDWFAYTNNMSIAQIKSLRDKVIALKPQSVNGEKLQKNLIADLSVKITNWELEHPAE